MAHDPAMLFYPSDFMMGTMTMTDDEVGKYIRILCIMHQQGRLTEKAVLTLVKEVPGTVRNKFLIDDDGLWYNERLEFEKNKRLRFTDSRKMNLHMGSHMATHVENENVIINEKGKEKKETLKEQKLRLIEARKLVFHERVFEFKNDYPEAMLIKFFDYWTEVNKSGSQMKWEMERTWELKKRLSYWSSRDREFNKGSKPDELITYRELIIRTGENKTSWDMWEQVTPGDKRSLWRLKKPKS